MATPTDLGAAEAAIRARLVAIVESVDGISAQVHDYWRNVQNEAVRSALLKDSVSGSLHFWFVSLAFDSTLTQERDGTLSKNTLVYDLHSYYAVSDASQSEKLFAVKVLDVVTALNLAQKLRLASDELAFPVIRDSGPVQLLEFNQVEFTNVLCHHARIQVPVVFSGGDC
jgi:hypothetical protein